MAIHTYVQHPDVVDKSISKDREDNEFIKCQDKLAVLASKEDKQRPIKQGLSSLFNILIRSTNIS